MQRIGGLFPFTSFSYCYFDSHKRANCFIIADTIIRNKLMNFGMVKIHTILYMSSKIVMSLIGKD